MVPFEKTLMSYYRPFIVTRFRDFTAFVLQYATFPHSPLVSPKFPHVPLEVGGWFWWATKSEGVGLIFRAITVISKISNVCGPDP